MSVPTPYGGNRNAISAKSLSVSKPPALKAFMRYHIYLHGSKLTVQAAYRDF